MVCATSSSQKQNVKKLLIPEPEPQQQQPETIPIVGDKDKSFQLSQEQKNDTTNNAQKSSTQKNASPSRPPPPTSSPSSYGEFAFARAVCTRRSFISESNHNPYHEPLAKLFINEDVTNMMKQDVMKRNQVDALVARHMIVEKMIHDTIHPQNNDLNGPKQIIIFGAGFDTRANRFADILPIQKWFEIDLPDPQQFKIETLKKYHVSDPDNLIRISANLTDPTDGWYDKLEDAGWDSSAPTIFILEGLIYYLKTEEVRELLSSIPDVPNSKIILTIVEESLNRLFKKYLPPFNGWSTNLKELNKAGVLKFRNYKLKRNIGTVNPERSGLKVWVKKEFMFKVTVWDRIKYFFNCPLERVLEFEAV